MRTPFKAALFVFAAVLIVAVPPCEKMASSLAQEPGGPKKKKIIEWGWDAPTTKYLRVKVDDVERLPFDGVVIPLRYADGTDITWKMWGGIKYEYSRLAYMVNDLAQTPFKSLTDLFIRVNVTPGNVNWFDDNAWAAVLHNFTLAARVAKNGKCKGFVFDVEQYERKPFGLAASVATHNASAQEYRAKVRQRAHEWIGAVSQEFPNIQILFPWMYEPESTENYSLLPDFLDGIIEAAPPTVRLINAGEGSYKFKYPAEFQQAYYALKNSQVLSTVPELYRARIEVGFGIWADADSDKLGWHQTEPGKNFFSPDEFRLSVSYALQRSDEYVWIYSQKINWWTGRSLPPAYVEALRAAKRGN
jgi:hypothetical protein